MEGLFNGKSHLEMDDDWGCPMTEETSIFSTFGDLFHWRSAKGPIPLPSAVERPPKEEWSAPGNPPVLTQWGCLNAVDMNLI